MRWSMVLVMLPAAAAFAQRPWIGFKAGVPTADAFRSGAFSERRYVPDSGRYVIGPMFELRLPLRFSIELDLLYRSLKYRAQSEHPRGSYDLTTEANAWHFPLVGKFRLSGGLVAPYVAGGYAFQRLSGLKQVGTILSGTLPRTPTRVETDQPDELARRTNYGYVLGGGLEGRLPGVRISPEIRYTRWRQETFVNFGSITPVSRRSQVEVLVGIAF